MSYPPERNKEYLRVRYAKQRAEMVQFLGGECRVCSTDQELEIDHIDWRLKSFEVGGLWPIKKLPMVYEELRKCQLLCRKDHMLKSKSDLAEQRKEKEQPSLTHGTFGGIKRKCQCDLCKAKKAEFYEVRNESRRAKSSGARGAYGRPTTHGDKLHYTRGCRCDLCRAANAAYAKELRLKKM